MGTGEVALQATRTLAEAPPESGLIALCRQGDAQAFSRLVALHESMVFNLAARLLGNPEEAKDAAQDVFLQVFRTLGRFEGRSSLRTWIFRIVVNHCRNRQRWWRRRGLDRALPIEDLQPAEEMRAMASREAGPFEQVHRLERARVVQRALGRISFDHRAVLLLREVEGLSCEEIGATLGLPAGTVKSRLARAREAFRQVLIQCPEIPEGS